MCARPSCPRICKGKTLSRIEVFSAITLYRTVIDDLARWILKDDLPQDDGPTPNSDAVPIKVEDTSQIGLWVILYIQRNSSILEGY